MDESSPYIRWHSDTEEPFDRWIRETVAVRLGIPIRVSKAKGGVVLAYGAQLPTGEVGVQIDRRSYASWPAAEDLDPETALEPLGPARWRARLDPFALLMGALNGDLDLGSSPDPGCIPPTLRQRPVLDQWVAKIREAFVKASHAAGTPLQPLQPWGPGKRAAVFLSHDVDTLDGKGLLPFRLAYWLARLGRSVLTGDEAARRFYTARLSRWATVDDDPHFTIPEITAFEEEHGVRSSFYFFGRRLPLGRGVGRAYSCWSPRVGRVLRELDRGGWEVGLHGSRPQNDTAASFRAGAGLLAGALGHPVDGVRQHNLSLNVPKTWDAQFDAGLEYDASFGWNTSVGFRGGTAVPFMPPDYAGSRPPGLVVLPLVVMDGPLEREGGNDALAMVDRTRRLLDRTVAVGGVFSFLLHTTGWDEVDHPGVRQTYEALVRAAAPRSDLVVATGREIAWMWQEHCRRILGRSLSDQSPAGISGGSSAGAC